LPLYACIGRDHRNGVEHRLAVRPEHLKHLDSLGSALVFAGPLQTEDGQPIGSLVVIESATLSEAAATFERDPFVIHGVFQSHEISRWNWGINNPDKRGQ
jgi:uncharacterized protein YciI